MGCNQNYGLGSAYTKRKYNEKLKKHVSQEIRRRIERKAK